jgi:hypothetical protein
MGRTAAFGAGFNAGGARTGATLRGWMGWSGVPNAGDDEGIGLSDTAEGWSGLLSDDMAVAAGDMVFVYSPVCDVAVQHSKGLMETRSARPHGCACALTPTSSAAFPAVKPAAPPPSTNNHPDLPQPLSGQLGRPAHFAAQAYQCASVYSLRCMLLAGKSATHTGCSHSTPKHTPASHRFPKTCADMNSDCSHSEASTPTIAVMAEVGISRAPTVCSRVGWLCYLS